MDTPLPEQCLDARRPTFRTDLERLINCHSRENGSDTPDFILADFLVGCLETFDRTLRRREEWYGRTKQEPAGIELPNPPCTQISHEHNH